MGDDQKYYSDGAVDDITIDTGVVDELPILTLDTDDGELIRDFKRWVQDSKSYWDDKNGYDLTSARNRNERYYLGQQIDKSKLYAYQVPFIDNQIYVGTQSILAYVTGRDPACEITPEDDTPQSKVMAEDLENAVNIHSIKWQLAKRVGSATKNMYLKRVGIIKLKYDPIVDDIVPIALDPNRVILDKDCLLDEEPRFICEICTDSVADLIKRFPAKEADILQVMGRQRKTPKLLGQIVAYNEVWFTDQTAKNDDDRECVAWYLGDTILDKSRNPNFLYEAEGLNITNFIDMPTKPYILFNYINDGTHLIDQTSPVEQAIPLQDVLNKRGRQIVENADTANSLLVIKTGAIPDEDAANITRDPNQILMLNTPDEMPVNAAYGEIPPHLLPNYVLQDKQDIKNSIHNILGTPSQFRGDDSKREVGTLGEAKMMMSQSSGRQDEVIRCIEYGLDRYFRLLVQMMKVHYDKKKQFATRDNDGSFLYVELSRENMPDVANVSVSQGSILKPDKERRENIAMSMAKMGLIDPYNLFKDLGLKDADKRYEALVKFKMAPDSLVSDVKSEVQNRDAYVDFTIIMNGQDAEPRKDIQPSYILAMRELLLTDTFLYAKPELQQKLIQYIEDAVIGLAQRAKLEEADKAGLLLDPNMPVTPEPPQLPPTPMPMPGMPGGMPPMGAPGQPPMPLMPDAGAPMNPMAGAAPAPNPAPAPVLSNLLPGM